LPASEWKKISDACTIVELEKGQVLWEAEEKGKYVYFPISSLISLMYESESGGSISVSSLGRHGIVGTSIVLGVRTPDRAVVTYPGSAYQLGSGLVRKELSDCGDFHELLMKYTHGLLTQIAQTAICNRLHRLDQQMCRFLLELNDELNTEMFLLTHAQLASLIGVRRESVSITLANLSSQGIIEPGRGRITISDLTKLRSIVCECYDVISASRERIINKYRAEHRS
jgi:CRP-like cAMP-binding protein